MKHYLKDHSFKIEIIYNIYHNIFKYYYIYKQFFEEFVIVIYIHFTHLFII